MTSRTAVGGVRWGFDWWSGSPVGFLSPLPGLVAFCATFPRLTPWATIFRRSAAGSGCHFAPE